MKEELKTINKIQDLMLSLEHQPIQFPEIVCIGSQSSGKSSVLEAIVKKPIFPRGSGMVTRCPLVLQLIRTDAKHVSSEGDPCSVEWGEFLHAPNQRFPMEAISHEIQRETDELTQSRPIISNKRITLKIFSPDVVNLTLVDLPGIIKIASEGQPRELPQQIDALHNEYARNPFSIILAVSPANMDLGTSDSMKLAKEVDPNGQRTLAVLTKLDLFPPGVDARPILKGDVIRVEKGIVGVINRSEEDSRNGKTIEAALIDEGKFLSEKYPDEAHKHGMTYLANKLSALLLDHVREHLPAVQADLSKQIHDTKEVLRMYRSPVTDKKQKLCEIIEQFNKSFSSQVLAQTTDITKKPLCGGALICYYVHKKLKDNMLKYSDHSTEEAILAMKNCVGLTPTSVLSDHALDTLIGPKIHAMLNPSIECLERVKQILLDASRDTLPKSITHFPHLQMDVLKHVNEVVEHLSDQCDEKIRDLIKQEKDHITYYRLQQESHNMAVAESADSTNDDSVASDERLDSFIKKDPENKEALLDTLGVRSPNTTLQLEFLEKTVNPYTKLVAKNLHDILTKTIVSSLVRKCVQEIPIRLMRMCLDLKGEDLEKLFAEKQSYAEKRQLANQRLKVLEEALKYVDAVAIGYENEYQQSEEDEYCSI